eukprot:CAMPEP_0185840880 /NCGR_PEP_ID=MMETSP1353-20130828/16979_1 /TAXON_ID=1077150 /ORGANISM="Erythrolobus australicus, Strain CCMP3124" /LENGTH=95 /DNA_ID=CAMNT_0028540265 /DNA_START=571 /DNA_END=854 /DNA_ORIENTATION=-
MPAREQPTKSSVNAAVRSVATAHRTVVKVVEANCALLASGERRGERRTLCVSPARARLRAGRRVRALGMHQLVRKLPARRLLVRALQQRSVLALR